MSDNEAQARLDNYLSHMLEAAHLARQYVKEAFAWSTASYVASVFTLTNSWRSSAFINFPVGSRGRL